MKTDFFLLIIDACVPILLMGERVLPAAEEQHGSRWRVDGNVFH
jgi:hypothetical protein